MGVDKRSVIYSQLTEFLSEYNMPTLEKYLIPFAFEREDDEPVEMLKEIYPIHTVNDSNYYELMEIGSLMPLKGLSHYIPLSLKAILGRLGHMSPYEPI